MTNRYFDPGPRRAAQVDRLFSQIARRYDLLNDLQSLGLHRFWKKRLVARARLTPGQVSLDLCCGTGDLAFASARSGPRVIGLDFNQAMLEVARRRQGSPPSGNPRFVRGDALRLPFARDQFHLITVAYGLRNLADLERALAEIWRVTLPGGRLFVLDFGKPENPLWRRLYFFYLQCWVPFLGRLFSGDAAAYGYILESLRHFPAQQEFSSKLRTALWVDVRFENSLGGAMCLHSARKPIEKTRNSEERGGQTSG